jgi:ankyrin repeat protein
MYAGKHCISDAARVLIKGGADFRTKSKSGKTAHDIAIEEKCENLGAYKFDI